MEYLHEFVIVAFVHFLAIISPGPDFIMITRNSLAYSRRTGIFSSIGLGAGILVHVTYSLLGIALIISQSILLFNALKILGAIYLIYIGYKSLTSKDHTSASQIEHKRNDLTPFQAFRIGLLTNATNPKATLFFLSLFTLVISPSTPLYIKLLYAVEMVIATILWFCLVAIVFSHPKVKGKLSGIQHTAEKVMGGILIILGLKIASDT